MPEQLPAMPSEFEELNSTIERAVASGQLLHSAARNIRNLLAGAASNLYSRVVEELVVGNEWAELNDRFYKTLEFGTGGLPGRTVRTILTAAGRGSTRDNGRPPIAGGGAQPTSSLYSWTP